LPFPRSVTQVDALLFTYLDEVRKPSNTLFVLDVSGSMEGRRIQQLKSALANLTGGDQSLTGQFARFRAREEVAMLPFSGKPHTLRNCTVNETDPDSADMRALRDYISGLTADGGTGIYDALAAGYQIVKEQMQREPDHFYSIVLLTDGENTNGTNFDQFYGIFPEIAGSASEVKLFPILFGNSADEEMETLAELTGGRTFDAHAHSLAEVFKKIRGYQ